MSHFRIKVSVFSRQLFGVTRERGMRPLTFGTWTAKPTVCLPQFPSRNRIRGPRRRVLPEDGSLLVPFRGCQGQNHRKITKFRSFLDNPDSFSQPCFDPDRAKPAVSPILTTLSGTCRTFCRCPDRRGQGGRAVVSGCDGKRTQSSTDSCDSFIIPTDFWNPETASNPQPNHRK